MGARTNLAQAYYDLATMMDAGMPILRSIDIVIEGRQGHLKQIFKRIRETITDGSSLAEALGEHPRTFPDLDRMLIEAAETSGALGASLTTLSQWHDFVHRITRRMLVAMIYPVLILHIAAFVFPFPGLILGGLTINEYLFAVLRILLILYIPVAVVLVIMLLRNRAPLLKLPLDMLVLRVPVLGLAVYHISVCRYAKAFAMLYGAGVPIVETTERATRVTGNLVVARQLEGAKASVRAGGMVCEGFSDRIPTEYRQLWQIGEETGELDKTSNKIAEIAGDRADLFFTEFGRWLPRVVYFIILIMIAIMIIKLAGQVQRNISSSLDAL